MPSDLLTDAVKRSFERVRRVEDSEARRRALLIFAKEKKEKKSTPLVMKGRFIFIFLEGGIRYSTTYTLHSNICGWLVGSHRPKRKKEGHLFYYDDAHVYLGNHASLHQPCENKLRKK